MTTSAPTVVENGPRQVSRSIVVDAPASTLFAILSHPDRHHEVDGSGTVQDVSNGNDPMVEGGTFTVRMKAFGIPYSITSKVTEIVPDRVVEWQHPGGHRWRYDFESIGPNRTRVTESWDYRDAKSPKFLELTGFPRRNARGIENTLERMATQFSSS